MNLATLERLNTQLRINSERQLRTLEQRDKAFETASTAAPAAAVATASPEDLRLRALKRDLAQLEGFPDKHPDVRRLKDAIAALEAETRRAARSRAAAWNRPRGAPGAPIRCPAGPARSPASTASSRS